MDKEFKTVKVGQEARDELVKALGLIASAVGSTLGPGGRPWGFDKKSIYGKLSPTWSKDGLTVLRSLWFSDPAVQAVLHYCKQASNNSVLASGDGSTSSIILASAVANAIHQLQKKKIGSPQAKARQLEIEAEHAIEAIKKDAIKSDEAVRSVALTSSNGDEELTNVVMEAIGYTSAYGTLHVEKNPATSTRYSIHRQDGYGNVGGYQYNLVVAGTADQKAASFAPIVWANPIVALFNGNMLLKEQLDPILKAWGGSKAPLLIVAYDVSDELMNKIMILNRTVVPQGGYPAFVVKPKLTAEMYSQLQILKDIASYCGIDDKYLIDGGTYKNVDATFFGTCKSVTITPNSTMFMGRSNDHWVEKRVAQNNSIIAAAKTDFDRQFTSLRNAELAEGLVRIEIGGGTLPDLCERADRFDDASKAAQACLKSGALPGGGLSYIRAGQLANVSPELFGALSKIHTTVMENYDTNKTISVPIDGVSGFRIGKNGVEFGLATDLKVLDSVETVVGVIRNGVALGCNIATLGGYAFRDLSRDEEEA
jgi:chaperonin GroEL